ncbi:MAG: hypothetical protein KJN90_14795 [Gammaproteobacteria bacterium]|nr:hypothetical protein [Gammaproteobacteria bacterium]
MNKMFLKLLSPRIWRRIYLERLGEPFLYNLMSVFYYFFGSIETKIDYDLIPRQPYAFGIKEAFVIARAENATKIYFVEFGVAAGAGLFSLAHIASRLSPRYKIDYQIVGFDTGKGMPEAVDYRDHPEKYREGDFPPVNLTPDRLPEKTTVYYGDIADEVKKFAADINEQGGQLGFVAIDVDYYSSTVKCLKLFELPAGSLLSRVPVYLDDVNHIDHNPFCGELLAVNEFNQRQDISRKVCQMNQLRNWRIFKNALWLDQMYFLHVFDSHYRQVETWQNEEKVVLANPFLSTENI